MKQNDIDTIIQWMTDKAVKTVRTKFDKTQQQWGLLACDFKDRGKLQYDHHFHRLVMQDVTLVVTSHPDGICGRVGYAEGKPVVAGQRIPDFDKTQYLHYDPRQQLFYMDNGHTGESVVVTSLKWMWLEYNGRAYGIV